MRVPFVVLPRSLYEDMRQRIRTLEETLLDLKLAGAQVRRTVPAGVRLEPRPRSAIEEALDEHPRCRQNPRLRARLLAWAEDELASGRLGEDAVVDQLRRWDSRRAAEDEDDADLIRTG